MTRGPASGACVGLPRGVCLVFFEVGLRLARGGFGHLAQQPHNRARLVQRLRENLREGRGASD